MQTVVVRRPHNEPAPGERAMRAPSLLVVDRDPVFCAELARAARLKGVAAAFAWGAENLQGLSLSGITAVVCDLGEWSEVLRVRDRAMMELVAEVPLILVDARGEGGARVEGLPPHAQVVPRAQGANAVVATATERPALAIEASRPEEPADEALRVAIVDDNRSFADGLALAARRHGLGAEVFQTVAEALAARRQGVRHDVVLIDFDVGPLQGAPMEASLARAFDGSLVVLLTPGERLDGEPSATEGAALKIRKESGAEVILRHVEALAPRH